jgi:16S rRNA (cytidine1402-2'-O)-methyltransferase
VQEIALAELNDHTPQSEVPELLAPLVRGEDLGLLSEAGCPAVADPGARLVALAHAHDIRVVPLVGPSAILLALMASGLDGQHFTFLGYLPAERDARRRRIQQVEKESARTGATCVWIETPYRADAMLDALLSTCRPTTRIGVAVDLTLAAETTLTLTTAAWLKRPRPALARRQTVFLLAASPELSAPGGSRGRRA